MGFKYQFNSLYNINIEGSTLDKMGPSNLDHVRTYHILYNMLDCIFGQGR